MIGQKKWVGMIAILAMMLIGAGSSWAATQTWTGSTDTDWNTATNWDDGAGGGAVPLAADTAIIPSVANQPTVPAAGGTCLNLQINTTAGAVTITLAGDLTIAAGGTVNVTAGANASAITGAANLVMGGASTVTNASTGLLTISAATDNTGGDITVTGAGDAEISGVISGTSKVIMSGTGTLTLSGANTYTGNTEINSGTVATVGADRLDDGSSVAIGAAGTLSLGGSETIRNLTGAAGAVINIGANTLTVTQTVADLYAGVISGTGNLIKLGAETLTLSGSNTYTGTTTISAGGLTTGNADTFDDASAVVVDGGTLTLGASETIGDLSGAGGTIALATFTLTVTQTHALGYAGTITGAAASGLTLSAASTNTLTLSGANTFTGTLTLAAGTAGGITLSGGSAIANTATVVVNDGTLTLGASETIGDLSGTGGTIALATFTLTVTQTSAQGFAGTITGSDATCGFTLGAGTTNTLTISGTNTFPGTTTLAGGILGGLTLSGGAAIANAAAVVVNGGTLTLGASETIGDLSGAGGTIALATFTLTVTQTSPLEYSGIISGAGASGLALGAGSTAVLTLSGTNTFTGTTTLAAGITGGITTGSATTFADASIMVVNGGTLTLGANETIGNLSGTGGVIALATFTLTVTQTADGTYAGVISGAAASGLTLGAGSTNILTLSGTNTYTGTTTLIAGITGGITTGSATTFADASKMAINGGTLLLGASETIGSLGGIGGVIDLATFTLTVNQTNVNSFTGVIQGAGGFTLGAGTTQSLTLFGANTFTGALTLSAGNLVLSNAVPLAAGAINLATGSIMTLDTAVSAANWNRTITLTGAATIMNTGGASEIDQTIDNGGNTLTLSGNQDLTISGAISGAGDLTVNMTAVGNKVFLTAANGYTGATMVANGTLNLQNATAAGTTAAGTAVSAGAALQVQGGIAIGNETLTLTGGAATEFENVSGTNSWGGAVLLNAAAVDITATAGAITFGSTISGQDVTFNCTGDITVTGAIGTAADGRALTKTGAGVLTLGGVNLYTGATTVSAGTINFNGASTGVSAVAINGGKLAGTGTIPGAVTMATGTTLAPGANNGANVGTLTIGGGLTMNGESNYEVTITGGAVDLVSVTGAVTATGSTPNIILQAAYNTAGVVVPVAAIHATGAYTAFDAGALPAGFTFSTAKDGSSNVCFTAMAGAMVPTLSEWGIIFTLLLLAGAGVTFMRRQRQVGNIAA